jgi:GAF domain-containing protein
MLTKDNGRKGRHDFGVIGGRTTAMAEDTAQLLLDTFVDLADTLANDYDVGELLQLLVNRCTDLLVADTAGVLLETSSGKPALAAATSEEMLKIEDLEVRLGQGPCLEAYRSGEQVLVEDLMACHDRWPQFTPRIIELGMRSVSALPLRLRDQRIGALNLYRSQPSAFASHEIRLGQGLANIAAVGILQERRVFEADRRSDQLQHALDSRVVIEQAKGTLAERRGITLREAFEAMRTHARSNNLKLRDVCLQVLNGGLEPETVDACDRRRRGPGRPTTTPRFP